MDTRASTDARRALLDAKLTELALFAKELCPAATVEASSIQYEDEDGRVEMFPPQGVSDAERVPFSSGFPCPHSTVTGMSARPVCRGRTPRSGEGNSQGSPEA